MDSHDEYSTTRSAASAIYGLVVAGATLATSAVTDSMVDVAVSVVVTVLVYWAAETYAHSLAVRTVRGHALSRRDFWSLFVTGWPLVSASYLPLLALLVCALLKASVQTAVYVALIVTTVLLGAAGWTASRRTGLRGWRLAAATVVAAAFGLAMIGLKKQLH